MAGKGEGHSPHQPSVKLNLINPFQDHSLHIRVQRIDQNIVFLLHHRRGHSQQKAFPRLGPLSKWLWPTLPSAGAPGPPLRGVLRGLPVQLFSDFSARSVERFINSPEI